MNMHPEIEAILLCTIWVTECQSLPAHGNALLTLAMCAQALKGCKRELRCL